MTENRIFYISTNKKTLTSEGWPDIVDETLCNDLPYGVEKIEVFEYDFEPEMIEENDLFDVKKIDNFFELTLKDDAIIKVRELYSKALMDCTNYINRFVVIEEYNNFRLVNITYVEAIYNLVDFAIMKGTNKLYLYPQVGCYRY